MQETMRRADVDYLTRRAEQELELACRATHSAATAAHYRLSNFYLEQIEALQPSDSVRE